MFSADTKTRYDLPVMSTITEVRAMITAWRLAGESIAFVPTMGNLHEGHLALVRSANELAQHTVVSIFVNPAQFGPFEDFDSYPRTFDQDMTALSAYKVDMVFVPDNDTLYPGGSVAGAYIDVPALSGMLEGEHRPHFFTGVATVVNKLLNITQPDIALFGVKDYQQLLVIKRMVRDLAMPIEIHAVPTVREPDGLAMSSRNSYLTREQRVIAKQLYVCLQGLIRAINEGVEINFAVVHASQQLEAQGLVVDYVVVRTQQDLSVPETDDKSLIALAAVRLDEIRLIDNIPFKLKLSS